jgi:hypothetical protein
MPYFESGTENHSGADKLRRAAETIRSAWKHCSHFFLPPRQPGSGGRPGDLPWLMSASGHKRAFTNLFVRPPTRQSGALKSSVSGEMRWLCVALFFCDRSV